MKIVSIGTSGLNAIGMVNADDAGDRETGEGGMHARDIDLEAAMLEFRRELPPACATARAIDEHASWDKIAGEAVLDGYVDAPDQFKNLVEAVLGHAL